MKYFFTDIAYIIPIFAPSTGTNEFRKAAKGERQQASPITPPATSEAVNANLNSWNKDLI